MAYSAVSDLLIGDLPISDLVDKTSFVNDAADEIDAAIGGYYVVPVVTATLGRHVQTLLKKINAHLSTGRLIATIAIGSEDAAVNAYASSMIKEAQMLLMQVASGQIRLTGAPTVAGDGATDNGPRIKNYDDQSAVDVFSDFAMRPHWTIPIPNTGPVWAPGKSG